MTKYNIINPVQFVEYPDYKKQLTLEQLRNLKDLADYMLNMLPKIEGEELSEKDFFQLDKTLINKLSEILGEDSTKMEISPETVCELLTRLSKEFELKISVK